MFVLLQSMAVNMGSISSWAGAHEKVSHVMSHCDQKCHTCVVIAWLFVCMALPVAMQCDMTVPLQF